mmetsp:Transcript_31727/g.76848  ORF Transcript_31727/g.76848 Transcript_31727/m.76848 type:complete len:272 (+) Transcript_31727:113-928(+)
MPVPPIKQELQPDGTLRLPIPTEKTSATVPSEDQPVYLEDGPAPAEEGIIRAPPPALALALAEPEELHLIKPVNVKSRFWVHFMRYDPEYHPDKKTTARCALCGKDISVKQGTGGLKNHLKFKHPEEMDLLTSDTYVDVAQSAANQLPADAAAVLEPPSLGGLAAVNPARKKPRISHNGGENPYADITTMRMDTEKRNREKHLLEMWSATRREIRELRKELKEDGPGEDVVRELEGDIRALKKKKADYAEMLGLPKDDGMDTQVETMLEEV